MTRTRIHFLHGETNIDKFLVLGDGSFIVNAYKENPPNALGKGAGSGSYYAYRIDTRGRVLEERHDWAGMMSMSPIDLSYFFSSGPGAPMSWRDTAGATHRIGDLPSMELGPFRDRAGRFWAPQGYPNSYPGGRPPTELHVYEKPWRAGRKVDLGHDDVVAAAAGCDGAVWALTGNGRIWRVDGGGRTARIVTALPTGTTTFTDPYGGGDFTAMRDGSVWLATGRVDPMHTHLVHLDARGKIGDLPASQTDAFDGMTEGPDSALWGYGGHGLARLSAQGKVTTYPAPVGPIGGLQLGPGPALWYVCIDAGHFDYLCSTPVNV